jgi:hypothetical protein
MKIPVLGSGINIVSSVACSAGSVVASGAQTVSGQDIKPDPGSMRALLLAMEGSVHGRIPEILGDDEGERVETMCRFLDGTSEAEMNELMGLLQLAIARRTAGVN